MNDLKNKKEFWGIVSLIGLLVILALGVFLIQSFLVTTALVLGLFLVITFLYSPKFGILLFLIIRPIVDNLGEKLEIPIYIGNFSLNISALLGIVFLSLTSLFLIKEFYQASYKFKNWVFASWLIFIGFSIFSLIYSIDRFASFYEIIRILTIFLFFFSALIVTKKEKDLELFVKAILISALIPFLVAIYQLLTGTGLAGTTVGLDSRLYATFSHPNQFASFSLIILGLAWFKYQKETAHQKINWVPLVVTLILLVATFSRGAWLGIIIFSFIVGFLKNFKIVLLALAVLIILFFTSETVNKRIEDIYNPPATSSIYWRLERWTENYQSFSKKPLLGHGSGTELTVYENDYGFYSNNNYTHNDILKNAIEIGIWGTLTYLILILSTFFTLVKIYLKTSSAFLKNFSLVILAVFVAINVFSMTSNIFRGTATQWTLWFLIGACIGLYLERKTNRKS